MREASLGDSALLKIDASPGNRFNAISRNFFFLFFFPWDAFQYSVPDRYRRVADFFACLFRRSVFFFYRQALVGGLVGWLGVVDDVLFGGEGAVVFPR